MRPEDPLAVRETVNPLDQKIKSEVAAADCHDCHDDETLLDVMGALRRSARQQRKRPAKYIEAVDEEEGGGQAEEKMKVASSGLIYHSNVAGGQDLSSSGSDDDVPQFMRRYKRRKKKCRALDVILKDAAPASASFHAGEDRFLSKKTSRVSPSPKGGAGKRKVATLSLSELSDTSPTLHSEVVQEEQREAQGVRPPFCKAEKLATRRKPLSRSLDLHDPLPALETVAQGSDTDNRKSRSVSGFRPSNLGLHTCEDSKNCQSACVAKAVLPNLDRMSEEELVHWYEELTRTKFIKRCGEKIRGRVRRAIRAEAKKAPPPAPVTKKSDNLPQILPENCDASSGPSASGTRIRLIIDLPLVDREASTLPVCTTEVQKLLKASDELESELAPKADVEEDDIPPTPNSVKQVSDELESELAPEDDVEEEKSTPPTPILVKVPERDNVLDKGCGVNCNLRWEEIPQSLEGADFRNAYARSDSTPAVECSEEISAGDNDAVPSLLVAEAARNSAPCVVDVSALNAPPEDVESLETIDEGSSELHRVSTVIDAGSGPTDFTRDDRLRATEAPDVEVAAIIVEDGSEVASPVLMGQDDAERAASEQEDEVRLQSVAMEGAKSSDSVPTKASSNCTKERQQSVCLPTVPQNADEGGATVTKASADYREQSHLNVTHQEVVKHGNGEKDLEADPAVRSDPYVTIGKILQDKMEGGFCKTKVSAEWTVDSHLDIAFSEIAECVTRGEFHLADVSGGTIEDSLPNAALSRDRQNDGNRKGSVERKASADCIEDTHKNFVLSTFREDRIDTEAKLTASSANRIQDSQRNGFVPKVQNGCESRTTETGASAVCSQEAQSAVALLIVPQEERKKKEDTEREASAEYLKDNQPCPGVQKVLQDGIQREVNGKEAPVSCPDDIQDSLGLVKVPGDETEDNEVEAELSPDCNKDSIRKRSLHEAPEDENESEINRMEVSAASIKGSEPTVATAMILVEGDDTYVIHTSGDCTVGDLEELQDRNDQSIGLEASGCIVGSHQEPKNGGVVRIDVATNCTEDRELNVPSFNLSQDVVESEAIGKEASADCTKDGQSNLLAKLQQDGALRGADESEDSGECLGHSEPNVAVLKAKVTIQSQRKASAGCSESMQENVAFTKVAEFEEESKAKEMKASVGCVEDIRQSIAFLQVAEDGNEPEAGDLRVSAKSAGCRQTDITVLKIRGEAAGEATEVSITSADWQLDAPHGNPGQVDIDDLTAALRGPPQESCQESGVCRGQFYDLDTDAKGEESLLKSENRPQLDNDVVEMTFGNRVISDAAVEGGTVTNPIPGGRPIVDTTDAKDSPKDVEDVDETMIMCPIEGECKVSGAPHSKLFGTGAKDADETVQVCHASEWEMLEVMNKTHLNLIEDKNGALEMRPTAEICAIPQKINNSDRLRHVEDVEETLGVNPSTAQCEVSEVAEKEHLITVVEDGIGTLEQCPSSGQCEILNETDAMHSIAAVEDVDGTAGMHSTGGPCEVSEKKTRNYSITEADGANRGLEMCPITTESELDSDKFFTDLEGTLEQRLAEGEHEMDDEVRRPGFRPQNLADESDFTFELSLGDNCSDEVPSLEEYVAGHRIPLKPSHSVPRGSSSLDHINEHDMDDFVFQSMAQSPSRKDEDSKCKPLPAEQEVKAADHQRQPEKVAGQLRRESDGEISMEECPAPYGVPLMVQNCVIVTDTEDTDGDDASQRTLDGILSEFDQEYSSDQMLENGGVPENASSQLMRGGATIEELEGQVSKSRLEGGIAREGDEHVTALQFIEEDADVRLLGQKPVLKYAHDDDKVLDSDEEDFLVQDLEEEVASTQVNTLLKCVENAENQIEDTVKGSLDFGAASPDENDGEKNFPSKYLAEDVAVERTEATEEPNSPQAPSQRLREDRTAHELDDEGFWNETNVTSCVMPEEFALQERRGYRAGCFSSCEIDGGFDSSRQWGDDFPSPQQQVDKGDTSHQVHNKDRPPIKLDRESLTHELEEHRAAEQKQGEIPLADVNECGAENVTGPMLTVQAPTEVMVLKLDADVEARQTVGDSTGERLAHSTNWLGNWRPIQHISKNRSTFAVGQPLKDPASQDSAALHKKSGSIGNERVVESLQEPLLQEARGHGPVPGEVQKDLFSCGVEGHSSPSANGGDASQVNEHIIGLKLAEESSPPQVRSVSGGGVQANVEPILTAQEAAEVVLRHSEEEIAGCRAPSENSTDFGESQLVSSGQFGHLVGVAATQTGSIISVSEGVNDTALHRDFGVQRNCTPAVPTGEGSNSVLERTPASQTLEVLPLKSSGLAQVATVCEPSVKDLPDFEFGDGSPPFVADRRKCHPPNDATSEDVAESPVVLSQPRKSTHLEESSHYAVRQNEESPRIETQVTRAADLHPEARNREEPSRQVSRKLELERRNREEQSRRFPRKYRKRSPPSPSSLMSRRVTRAYLKLEKRNRAAAQDTSARSAQPVPALQARTEDSAPPLNNEHDLSGSYPRGSDLLVGSKERASDECVQPRSFDSDSSRGSPKKRKICDAYGDDTFRAKWAALEEAVTPGMVQEPHPRPELTSGGSSPGDDELVSTALRTAIMERKRMGMALKPLRAQGLRSSPIRNQGHVSRLDGFSLAPKHLRRWKRSPPKSGISRRQKGGHSAQKESKENVPDSPFEFHPEVAEDEQQLPEACIDLLAREDFGEIKSPDLEPPSKLPRSRKTISPSSQLQLMRASSDTSPPSSGESDSPRQKDSSCRLKAAVDHAGGLQEASSQITHKLNNDIEPSRMIGGYDGSDSADVLGRNCGSSTSEVESFRTISLCLSPPLHSPPSAGVALDPPISAGHQIAPPRSPAICAPGAPSGKGILKTSPQRCTGLCKCQDCTESRSKVEKVSSFIAGQMTSFMHIAGQLTKEVEGLRALVETNLPNVGQTDEVQVSLKKSKDAQDCAQKDLVQLLRDSKRVRKLIAVKPSKPPSVRKIVFADEAGKALCQVKTFQSQSPPRSVLDVWKLSFGCSS